MIDMDAAIFKKMKVRPSCAATAINAPSNYPMEKDFNWVDRGRADFVHVFVDSRDQFTALFPQAKAAFKEDGLFWVSYPKSTGKKTYDINRDSLWGLLMAAGFHPVSQVALDEEWSALRVKRNETGVVYEPPSNIKK